MAHVPGGPLRHLLAFVATGLAHVLNGAHEKAAMAIGMLVERVAVVPSLPHDWDLERVRRAGRSETAAFVSQR